MSILLNRVTGLHSHAMIEIVYRDPILSLPVTRFRLKRLMSQDLAYVDTLERMKQLGDEWIDSMTRLTCPPDPVRFDLRPKDGADLDAFEAKLKEIFPSTEISRYASNWERTTGEWVGGHIDYKAFEDTGHHRQIVRLTNAATPPLQNSLIRMIRLGDVHLYPTTSGEVKKIHIYKDQFVPQFLHIPPGRSVDVTIIWLSTEVRHHLATNPEGFTYSGGHEVHNDLAMAT